VTKPILALAAALLLAPQDEFDKSKHPWLKWKEGATVEYTMSQEMGEMKNEGSYTLKLSKVTDKGYTVMTTVDMGGSSNDTEDTQELPVKDGEESVTVGEDKYDCVIWKNKGSRSGEESETRIWLAKDKGLPVKLVTKGKQGFEVTATKFGENVEADGKKYECVRLEGKMEMGQNEAKFTMWYSPEVPGGAVQAKIEFEMGENKGTILVTLKKYDAKKANEK